MISLVVIVSIELKNVLGCRQSGGCWVNVKESSYEETREPTDHGSTHSPCVHVLYYYCYDRCRGGGGVIIGGGMCLYSVCIELRNGLGDAGLTG